MKFYNAKNNAGIYKICNDNVISTYLFLAECTQKLNWFLNKLSDV